MSEEDVPAIVAGAEVLHFPQKKAKKPRARKARPANENDGPDDLDVGGFDIEDMNDEWALVLLGAKSLIVREVPDAPVEDRLRFLGIDAFKTYHLNSYTERRNSRGEIKVATHAEAFLRSTQRRTYNGVEFFPDPDMEPGTPGYLNLWRGFSVVPAKREGAKYGIFADHILTNICKGNYELRDWIFGWFAHMVQRPRERTGTAIVLRGGRGTGKTKLGEVMGSLLASHYFLVDDPRYMVGQFNAHLASCLLLQADEGFWAGDKAAEGRLKGLITAEYQMIESKGVDPIRLKNYVRLYITSNEDWVVPAGKDERRYCVCDVGDGVAQNHGYFAEMEAELSAGGREALLHDLLAFDLSKVNLRVAPHTDALLEQKLRTLDDFDLWLFGRLDEGTTRRAVDRWEETVAKNELYDDYMTFADKIGIKRKRDLASWGKLLRKALPDIKEERPWSSDPAAFGRPRHYRLPSLEEARSAFELHVRQRVPWSDVVSAPRESAHDANF